MSWQQGLLAEHVLLACQWSQPSLPTWWTIRLLSRLQSCRVPLPQRVPYGFHSEHVPEHQFRQQAEDIPYTSVWPTRGTVPQ